MKILILGGTGRTGIQLVEEGLRRGHKINALVRTPEKLRLESPDLQVITGTPINLDDLREAMKGVEVVFSALNISMSSELPWAKLTGPKDFISNSIRNVIKVMREEGVKRIIVMSTAGAGDSVTEFPRWFRWLTEHSSMKYAYKEHGEQEKLLKQSDLDWTAIRPMSLSNSQKAKEVMVSFGGVPKPKRNISRRNVANFMLDIAENNEYIGQTPTISEK